MIRRGILALLLLAAPAALDARQDPPATGGHLWFSIRSSDRNIGWMHVWNELRTRGGESYIAENYERFQQTERQGIVFQDFERSVHITDSRDRLVMFQEETFTTGQEPVRRKGMLQGDAFVVTT
ncbi:MAG: hypothetical protein ACYTAF_09475, partial [Planctomycetota bacterium]